MHKRIKKSKSILNKATKQKALGKNSKTNN